MIRLLAFTVVLLFFSLSLPAQSWLLNLPMDSLDAIIMEDERDQRHFAALYTKAHLVHETRFAPNMLDTLTPMVTELYALAEELGPPFKLRATLAEQISMISVCEGGDPTIYSDSARHLARRVHAAIGEPANADEAELVLAGYLNLAYLCDRFYFFQDSFETQIPQLLEELPNLGDSTRLAANLMLTLRLQAKRRPGDLEQANRLLQESILLAENLPGAYQPKHKLNDMMTEYHYHTTGDTAKVRYFAERSLASLATLPAATARDSFNIYWYLFEAFHEAEDYPRALGLVDKLVELEERKIQYEMFSSAWRMELLALMDSTVSAPYLERAMFLVDSLPNLTPDHRAEVIGSAGLYAVTLGDKDQARRLLRRFAAEEAKMHSTSGELLIFDRGHLQPLRSRALAKLAELEAEIGNHAAASGFYQRAVDKKDIQASVDKNLLRSQAAYRLDVAENQRLRDLAEAESEQSAIRADADRKTLYWGLGLATLVAAIIAFAYLRARRDRRIITEQKTVVDAALTEKEVLLREIHHRVKNNLQIISSLLQKQARVAGDDGAKDFAKQGQERIQSMALVHENLYQSEQLNGVNIRDYLTDLAANIKRGHDGPETAVDLDLRVANETLDLDTAIPVGLILNELLTNAYKYAFAGRPTGKITVDFGKQGNEHQLRVSDDGVGLPADHAERQKTSLGHNLVSGLVRQLEGTIEWLGGKPSGTTVNIIF